VRERKKQTGERMNKFIERSDGIWNNPFISSETLDIDMSGFAPKFRGGCMGIVPNDDNFIVFGEDDDHYFEKAVMNKYELTTYCDILTELGVSITNECDYVRGTSKIKYTKTRRMFFNTNFSRGQFDVETEERKGHAPLVKITNTIIDFEERFDISWAGNKAEVVAMALKETE